MPANPQSYQISLSLNANGMEQLKLTDNYGQSFYVPSNENGLRVIRQLLMARQNNPNAKLGTFSRPTQQMIDAFLKNQKLEKENAIIQDRKEIALIF